MLEYQPDLPFSLQSPVVVVCHDAGAANLVFAWLRDWAYCDLLEQHEFRLVLQGPAQVAWQSLALALPKMQLHTELHTAMAGAHCLLTGTGWASSLEHDARKLASLRRIPCIAVIDHWVNYRQRFERASEVVLPDIIWVSDSYAADMATQMFKGIPVIELPNVYLQDMVKAIPPVQPDCRNVLYVLEPIRNDWGKEMAGEFQALDYFIQKINKIVTNQSFKIILRPHPSDPNGKYADWINLHSYLRVSLDDNISLIDSIADSKWVVGAETFAMVVAQYAGRLTYSSLPPWAHRCRLPQDGILHLRDLA